MLRDGFFKRILFIVVVLACIISTFTVSSVNAYAAGESMYVTKSTYADWQGPESGLSSWIANTLPATWAYNEGGYQGTLYRTDYSIISMTNMGQYLGQTIYYYELNVYYSGTVYKR